VELAAGADAELGEDLAEVVLDGVGADEQPGPDLRVGQAVPGELRDLALLRGQRIAALGRGPGRALAGGLSGSRQLLAGPFSESLQAHRVQRLVRGAELLAGPRAVALAAQPLAVEQVRAGDLGTTLGALWQSGQLPAWHPGREHQRDRVGGQPAGREPEGLRGGLVQPLLVVDQAGQRLFPGRLR